jgi:hypothetical protein
VLQVQRLESERGGTDGLYKRYLGDLHGHISAVTAQLVSPHLFTESHHSVWCSKFGQTALPNVIMYVEAS